MLSEVIARWRQGEPADALEVLREHPELRSDKSVVLDLAYEEYCLRAEAGEAVTSDSFVGRFPDYAKSLRKLIDAHRFLEQNPHLLTDRPAAISWPSPGTVYLGFDLETELGRGAFARVYLARERALADRKVVLKIAPHGAAEAATLGRLDHEGIVPVFSVHADAATGLTGVCMPFLGHATLSDVLDRAFGESTLPASAAVILQAARAPRQLAPAPTRVEPEDPLLHAASYTEGVAHLGVQLADALAYTHRKGILHLDLKPSNVLLTPAGRPMLLDFNLSRDQNLSQHLLGGTLPYMSPEQLEAATSRTAAAVDVRSDIFSLGVILYELLTGEVPFGPLPEQGPASELRDTLRVLHCRGAKPLKDSVPALDESLARAVEKCLALEPGKRFQSADELKAALARSLGWRQRTRRWARKHAAALVTASVLSVALGAGAAVAATTRDPYSVREFDKGKLAFRQGQYERAVEHLENATRESPNLAEAWYERGRAYQRMSNYRSAAASYQRVWDTSEDGRALAALGYCTALDGKKEWNSAANYLKRALDSGWTTAANYNNLGYCYRHTGRFTDAVEALDEALKLQPDLPASHHNLVLTHRLVAARHLSDVRGSIARGGPRLPLRWLDDVNRATSIAAHDPLLLISAAEVCCLSAELFPEQDLAGATLRHLEAAARLNAEPLPLDLALFAPLRNEPRFQALPHAQRAPGQGPTGRQLLVEPD